MSAARTQPNPVTFYVLGGNFLTNGTSAEGVFKNRSLILPVKEESKTGWRPVVWGGVIGSLIGLFLGPFFFIGTVVGILVAKARTQFGRVYPMNEIVTLTVLVTTDVFVEVAVKFRDGNSARLRMPPGYYAGIAYAKDEANAWSVAQNSAGCKVSG